MRYHTPVEVLPEAKLRPIYFCSLAVPVQDLCWNQQTVLRRRGNRHEIVCFVEDSQLDALWASRAGDTLTMPQSLDQFEGSVMLPILRS